MFTVKQGDKHNLLRVTERNNMILSEAQKSQVACTKYCHLLVLYMAILSCPPGTVVHDQEAIIYNSGQSILFKYLYYSMVQIS
jgi:hypothetical protein